MMVCTQTLSVSTRGNGHVVDITDRVAACLDDGGVADGTVTVFVVGSTASIATIEYEPGLAEHDLAAFLERIAPADIPYRHEATWHDDNGHSHVRATTLGPSLVVPIVSGRMTLGTWQQIVLVDCDTRPRERRIVVQIMGAAG